jgi:hypothetical protein
MPNLDRLRTSYRLGPDEVAPAASRDPEERYNELKYNAKFSCWNSRHVAAPIAFRRRFSYALGDVTAPADLPRCSRDLLPRKSRL